MSEPRLEGICRNCAADIVFGLYWVGRTPAAPRAVWYHPPGNQTCLIKPEGWKGDGGWPMAEPVSPEFEAALNEVIEHYREVLERLANQ